MEWVCAVWSAWAFVLEAGAVWVERQKQTAALQTWASGRRCIKIKKTTEVLVVRLSLCLPVRVCFGVVAVACDFVDESVAVVAFGEEAGELPPASHHHTPRTHTTHTGAEPR